MKTHAAASLVQGEVVLQKKAGPAMTLAFARARIAGARRSARAAASAAGQKAADSQLSDMCCRIVGSCHEVTRCEHFWSVACGQCSVPCGWLLHAIRGVEAQAADSHPSRGQAMHLALVSALCPIIRSRKE